MVYELGLRLFSWVFRALCLVIKVYDLWVWV